MRRSVFDKYRDIRVSIHGAGYVFGDFDCFTDKEKYTYSLRAVNAGATILIMENRKFKKHCKEYLKMGEAVANSVFTKDMV